MYICIPSHGGGTHTRCSTKPQENVSQRYRAKFVARPSDPKDSKIEKFRKDRSELSNTKKLFDIE